MEVRHAIDGTRVREPKTVIEQRQETGICEQEESEERKGRKTEGKGGSEPKEHGRKWLKTGRGFTSNRERHREENSKRVH